MTDTKPQLLLKITAAMMQAETLRRETEELVMSAREAGATWREIAAAEGTTVSNTYSKYARKSAPDPE
jgi:hypothetical protein